MTAREIQDAPTTTVSPAFALGVKVVFTVEVLVVAAALAVLTAWGSRMQPLAAGALLFVVAGGLAIGIPLWTTEDPVGATVVGLFAIIILTIPAFTLGGWALESYRARRRSRP
ncbi:MAG: hypothetical protein GEU78_03250 [Actinobacteria bacterium]|nr:hypothetical protein [Actinomycetota bacterium]